MEQAICQSCAMPLTSDDMFGTNADGSVNKDYCKWCYDKGEFLDKCTMEEYIEKCSQFGEQAGMTNEQMKEYCTKVFPTLKRWKKDQSDGGRALGVPFGFRCGLWSSGIFGVFLYYYGLIYLVVIPVRFF